MLSMTSFAPASERLPGSTAICKVAVVLVLASAASAGDGGCSSTEKTLSMVNLTCLSFSSATSCCRMGLVTGPEPEPLSMGLSLSKFQAATSSCWSGVMFWSVRRAGRGQNEASRLSVWVLALLLSALLLSALLLSAFAATERSSGVLVTVPLTVLLVLSLFLSSSMLLARDDRVLFVLVMMGGRLLSLGDGGGERRVASVFACSC
ncbi:hypothetical protein F5883DRAFT_556352 [Diaporthe sp. PMI_573]|nr:hypothetical protein F5883DRAFT_556352 [Diaporthaceae sp. PMI_573]